MVQYHLQPPLPPGTRAFPLRLVPAPAAERRSFSFNSKRCKGVRGRAGFSRLLLHRSLPPPIRVSGEWVTEGGGGHTTPPGQRPPTSFSFLRRTPRNSRESWPELARAPRSQCGAQQVRLAGAGPRTSSSRAWHRCACSGGGRPGLGVRRRRAESLALSGLLDWQLAQRQVRPPGESSPCLPRSLVGQVGLQ